jgi:hypothetical protein
MKKLNKQQVDILIVERELIFVRKTSRHFYITRFSTATG